MQKKKTYLYGQYKAVEIDVCESGLGWSRLVVAQ